MPAPNNIAFITGLDEFNSSVKNKLPQWFNEERSKGLARFGTLGVPTTKDEEWKYTNVAAPISSHKYKIPLHSEFKEKTEFEQYYDKKDINLVFINGFFSKEYSTIGQLPQGVIVSTLQEALGTHEKEVSDLLKKYSDNEDAFTALNKTLLNNGGFIKVDPKVILDPLIHIIHITSFSGDAITAPRTVILMGKSSEAKVLESHVSFTPMNYLASALTDIHLHEDSKLIYCKAQGESTKSIHIGTTRIWQERDSQATTFSLTTGGAITRNNLNIILNGTGAHAMLNGLYTVKDHQHVDNHTLVDHRPPNCTSTQLYKGLLNDSSRAVFNGKIYVKREAQQTNSYQLNKNLLLGKDCRIDTKPQLEIFADDVKCTHGATIGQLNEDEIFYLQSRCIPRPMAERMLARGFIDDILSTIPSTSITEKLNKLLRGTFAELK